MNEETPTYSDGMLTIVVPSPEHIDKGKLPAIVWQYGGVGRTEFRLVARKMFSKRLELMFERKTYDGMGSDKWEKCDDQSAEFMFSLFAQSFSRIELSKLYKDS